jgi:hypothetical protein
VLLPLISHLTACPDRFAAGPGHHDNTVTNSSINNRSLILCNATNHPARRQASSWYIQGSLSSTRINFRATYPACPDAACILQFTVLYLFKVTKPDDEHNLQAPPTLPQACFSDHIPGSVPFKVTAANSDNMGKLFVTLFAFAPALKTNL